jgi:ATP/maltotriose-dependent transcriptional regulator MalT/DNA-binding SARP family transcriptional activator
MGGGSPDQIWIERPRAAAAVRTAVSGGSLLLVAGAGYGKTALLREALGGTGVEQAWVACTARHRDAGSLLEAVAAAIDDAKPGLAVATLERLRAATQTVETTALADGIVEDLRSLLVDPLVLVIDDAEVLSGSAEALGLVGRLLDAGLRTLPLAVASRRPLDLPTSPDNGRRLARLEQQDVAFDEDECEAMLRAHLARAPTAREVESLFRATQGWPLGVALDLGAQHSANGRSSAAQAVGEFIANEVLAHQLPDVRRAILESSVAPDLRAGSLRALGLPAALPETLRRAGIPLTPRTDGGGFAHHPLVREALRGQLDAELDRGELADLLARAAAHERERGRIAESVELLLEGGHFGAAAQEIGREGLTLARTAWPTVGRWIERLPPAERTRPDVKMVEGQVALAAGRQPHGDALLREAEDQLAAAGDEAASWLARSLRAGPLHEVGRWEELIGLADDFGPESLERGGPPAAVVALLAAGVLAATGHLERAERLAAMAVDSPFGPLVGPIDMSRQAYTAVPAGGVDEMRKKIEATVVQLERADPLGFLPITLGALGLVLTEQGHMDQALDCWQRTARAVNASGAHRAVAVHAHLARATGLAMAGRLAEAEPELALAQPLPELGFRVTWAHQARAAVAFARGDREQATDEALQAMEAVHGSPTVGDRMWALGVAVPILSALGHPERALAAVDGVLAFLDRLLPGASGSFWRAVLLAHRACLHAESGVTDAADADVVRAFELAGPAMHHVVRRTWPRLREPLAGALSRTSLDPVAAVRAVDAAKPGGVAAVELLHHPRAGVRRAAIPAAAASGHPGAEAVLAPLVDDPDERVAGAARAAIARLHAEPPALTITLLGGFTLRRGEWEIGRGEWRRPAAATLVRYLAIHHDHAVRAEDLLDALWPGHDEGSARRGLEVALSDARRVLEPDRRTTGRLEKAGSIYRLALGPRDRVDSEDFAAAARRALADPGPRLLEHAAGLWAGEPLPEDRNAAWSLAWRDGLLSLNAAVLGALTDARIDAGDPQAAAESARRMLEMDATDESAHRRLIVAYTRCGRRGQALRQYLACRHALVTELGVEPDAETARLHSRVLAGDDV